MTPEPRRIALIGAECTGKTTLSNDLAAEFDALIVPEYLREFVEVTGRVPVASEQPTIMQRQIEAEEDAIEHAMGRAPDLIICDPAALMTAVYSIVYFSDPSLVQAAVEHQTKYDATFWCGTDLPWEADPGVRDGPEYRDQVDGVIGDVVAEQGLDVIRLAGSRAERARNVSQHLASLRR